MAVISLYNQLRLTAPIHPGGRAFEVRPHGDYSVEFFGAYSGIPQGIGPCAPGTCSPTPTDPGVNDYQNYAGGVDVHWKFLPQTALVFESNFEGRSYFHPDSTVVPPGKILKLVAGAQGLVTPKIQAILKAGYAIGFDGAASTFIGRAEGTWTPNEVSTLTLGVLRDVNNAVGSASATDLRVYLNTKTFLIGRLGLHGNFAYDLISFTQGRGQSDQLFSARPRAGLRHRALVHPLGRLRVLQADVGLRGCVAAELHTERGILAPHLHVLARAAFVPSHRLVSLLCCSLVVLSAGCKGPRGSGGTTLRADEVPQANAPAATSTTLGPGDLIEVRVFEEADSSRGRTAWRRAAPSTSRCAARSRCRA